MKKNLSIIVFIFLNIIYCFAQTETIQFPKNKQHSLFFELFGSSLHTYNITYDCSFKMAEKHKIALCMGVHYTFAHVGYYGISPQINYLYGKKNHLELGIGYSLLYRTPWDYNKGEFIFGFDDVKRYVPIRIGYRYQKEQGGFFWKIAYVPFYCVDEYNFYSVKGKNFAFVWCGVAFGYTFKYKK
ncbi:MAG: hypothetical protein FWH18_04925 [Marinilabiliaceae bacterium]|nr:hypothetical protein [Marinilabiliaceae bacterium]